ncbi:MAG: hypothetical protein JWP01_188 [Myxococcales bacterium]|nr:hypothetical protein [Myxococcales bacterium]
MGRFVVFIIVLASCVPDSPRAIVGRAWEACVRFGEAVGTRVNGARLDAVVSACRRAIPTVAALSTAIRYDKILRDTAMEAGDYAAGKRFEYEIPSEITEITKEYFDRWQRLPPVPAERETP